MRFGCVPTILMIAIPFMAGPAIPRSSTANSVAPNAQQHASPEIANTRADKTMDRRLHGCKSPGAATCQPSRSLTLDVLGQNMVVRFGQHVSDSTRTHLDRELSRAATLVNDHARELDAADKRAISAIDSMYITASNKICIGEDGRKWIVSVDFIDTMPDTAWLASLWGHEGQHYLNRGKYKGATRWMDESVAAKRQLAIGKVIGFTKSEIAYLQHWASHDNQKVLHKHMHECYTVKSTE